MTVDEYIASFESLKFDRREMNCWNLIYGWLEIRGHNDLIAEVRSGLKGNWKAMLEPAWIAQRLEKSRVGAQGDIAVIRSDGRWCLGIVGDGCVWCWLDDEIGKVKSAEMVFFKCPSL